jgi:hypothetical protein
MIWWKDYVLSILGCVLVGEIISQIVSDLRYKNLIQLIYGVVLIMVLLNPLSEGNIADSIDFAIEAVSPQEYIDLGQRKARKMQAQCIKEACESYISNKANELGLTVLTEVHLSKTMEPDFVKIYGHAEAECQDQLEIILEDDLGITKENQVWMWNPGEKSS